MPCAATRTLSKVKSRAMIPRQPLVPNLMVMRERFANRGLRQAGQVPPASGKRWQFSAFPIKRFLFHGVDVADKKNTEKGNHRTENHISRGRVLQHGFVNDGPRIHEYDFDIEKDEEHRHE